MNRTAKIKRITREVEVELQLNLDGQGDTQLDTGIGFLDHMLDLLAWHSRFDLAITAKGDREVDDHHTVEDIGIALGEAFDCALGEAKGIRRYGSILLPMDESLVQVAIDASGRGLAVLATPFDGRIGAFDAQLIDEFFIAFARVGRLTLHASLLAGTNRHHMAEALFKGVGRALAEVVMRDEGASAEVPSSKGVLR
ncbi:imidazoleglycerol-phosphate dehydratase HisB [Candidatus Bipolaricaulota bacterium]|nr:imidazoleglycerol-phosphate dehydratase HisB [Candidatus Bipolaricaulota bacterium]